jgi:hypothetical protein
LIVRKKPSAQEETCEISIAIGTNIEVFIITNGSRYNFQKKLFAFSENLLELTTETSLYIAFFRIKITPRNDIRAQNQFLRQNIHFFDEIFIGVA